MQTGSSGGKAKTLGFRTSSFVMVSTSQEKILGCVLLSAFESEALTGVPEAEIPHSATRRGCDPPNEKPRTGETG